MEVSAGWLTPARALFPLALLGVLLSLIAVFGFVMHWDVCGNACSDPRWRQYGSLAGVPLGVFGAVAYCGCAFLSAPRPCLKKLPTAWGLALLCGIILGSHAYLAFIQDQVLHAWCLLCVAASLIGLAVSFAGFLAARVAGSVPQVGLGALTGLLLAGGAMAWGHRTYGFVASPDPLARKGAPPIHRPEAGPPGPELLQEKMREGTREGDPNAEISVDHFTDFQCLRCARLSLDVWPSVMRQLGDTRDQVLVRHRIFLLEGHPQARQAAHVALAASTRGQIGRASCRERV